MLIPGNLTSRFFYVAWPAWSPDLNPCDNWLWSYLKSTQHYCLHCNTDVYNDPQSNNWNYFSKTLKLVWNWMRTSELCSIPLIENTYFVHVLVIFIRFKNTYILLFCLILKIVGYFLATPKQYNLYVPILIRCFHYDSCSVNIVNVDKLPAVLLFVLTNNK